MAHVFISYKSETQEQALQVVERLERAGIDCWIACRDIPVGTDYIDEIPAAIEECTFFLLLMSELMYTSPLVKLELKQAISSNKRVMPLKLEAHEAKPPYPFMLQNCQIYPIYDDENGKRFEEVIGQIYKVAPQLKPKVAYAPVTPKTGNGCIFVSYSHRDSNRVLPLVKLLRERGFRVWLDEGQCVGAEWVEVLANQIRDCSCFMPFLSENYGESKFSQKELTYAMHLNKNMLCVYLEQANLPLGMQLQLSSQQAMHYFRYPDQTSFVDALSKAAVLMPCKE